MINLDNEFKEKVMVAANFIHSGDPLKGVFSEHDIHWLINRAAESFEAENEEAIKCPDCINGHLEIIILRCSHCGYENEPH